MTVTGTKVKSVSLKKSVSVKKGKSVTLKAKFKPEDASNRTVSWNSSNTKVATVNKDGKVKGIKKGKSTITVTTEDGQKKAKCTVTVK